MEKQKGKHSPEPWKVCCWAEGLRGFEIADRSQNRVCYDMTEIDAHLIAAAPELLAALQLAKDMFVANDLILPHTFEVIDGAIAKAKGGPL